MIGIRPRAFQEQCVAHLMDKARTSDNTKTIIKAPTGAGKTVILLHFIEKYIQEIGDAAFVWICPGTGNLEEQSHSKMRSLMPTASSKTLNELLLSGFEKNDTVFVNWELITKKGNRAVTDSERKNLFDHISRAHKAGLKFILIIDEEHSNDTRKASDLIGAFSAAYEIRVSATAHKTNHTDWYEISEASVIASGLITKAIYINEGIDSGLINNENELLLDLAIAKHKSISDAYRDMNKRINPLIIIQFPSSSSALFKTVEDLLEGRGYTYKNGYVAKWLAEERINTENITRLENTTMFLLMKQAISTGWDCPRAKILIKLRDHMSEDFEIQTIGRIRRMPEARHYEEDLLDNCYLYTFDEKYKQAVKESTTTAFDVKRVFLKDKCKTFSLTKQVKDKDSDYVDEREVCRIIYEFLATKYSLSSDRANNALILQSRGYRMEANVIRHVRKGEFATVSSIMDVKPSDTIEIKTPVDPHNDGMDIMHTIDSIKSIIGLTYDNTKAILIRLFRRNTNHTQRILSLGKNEFYAFILNNASQIRTDMREATSQVARNVLLAGMPKEYEFHIPEQDYLRYDASAKAVAELLTNAYHNYTEQTLVEGIRSKPERLFERYCESSPQIDWVYKNGDSGQQYFSIVYTTGITTQKLFYPDYIVKTKDGRIFIIETKGGEIGTKDKNIDTMAQNKFDAFKEYAHTKGILWGFVRDKDEHLYINFTEYTKNLSDPHWVSLHTIF